MFAGFDPSKVGKESGTAGSNLTCAFNNKREIEQCISGNYKNNYKIEVGMHACAWLMSRMRHCFTSQKLMQWLPLTLVTAGAQYNII